MKGILQPLSQLKQKHEITVQRGERSVNILMIAWNCHPSRDYYMLLKKAGYNVFWIGQDHEAENGLGGRDRIRPDVNIMRVIGKAKMYHGPMGACQTALVQQDINQFINVFCKNNEPDIILHFHNWVEMHGKPDVPYIFYASEPWHPEVPKHANRIITPTIAMREWMEAAYDTCYKYDVIPWAVRNDIMESMTKQLATESPLFDPKMRNVRCSFAGKIYNFDFYKPRADTVLKIEEMTPPVFKDTFFEFKGFEGHWMGKRKSKDPFLPEIVPPERGHGHLDTDDYVALMMRSQFGLNYPTAWGPNFRDFEVPACGSILLTKKTRDMEKLGFKDGVNCAYYHTPEEAVEIIKIGYDKTVAEEGWYNVVKNHTYHERIHDLVAIIEEML